MTKSNNNLILTVVIAIFTAVIGFIGGMQYQKGKTNVPNFGRFQNGFARPSGFMGRNNFGGNRPVGGEITNIDDKTITVKTQDNNSTIIIYSDSTKINKTSQGSINDLKTGEQIMVIGTLGADGTVTAQSISIGNNFMRGMPPNDQPPANQNN